MQAFIAGPAEAGPFLFARMHGALGAERCVVAPGGAFPLRLGLARASAKASAGGRGVRVSSRSRVASFSAPRRISSCPVFSRPSIGACRAPMDPTGCAAGVEGAFAGLLRPDAGGIGIQFGRKGGRWASGNGARLAEGALGNRRASARAAVAGSVARQRRASRPFCG